MKTVGYVHKTDKPSVIVAADRSGPPRIIRLVGDMTVGRKSKSSDADIMLSSKIVSREHGRFLSAIDGRGYFYMDRNSTNGTFINGTKLPPFNENGTKSERLFDGDIIRIDSADLSSPESAVMLYSTSIPTDAVIERFSYEGAVSITIGRQDINDIVIDKPDVSSEHARLVKRDDVWYINDLDSTNGVIVNGVEIEKETPLKRLDVIRICGTVFFFLDTALYYVSIPEYKCEMSINIDKRVVKHNFKNKLLLSDINVEFSGGDFVLILGGSGAGKTTFVKAITGEGKAKGKVVLDGIDLYKNYRSVKSQIGIVPQQLTLRLSDTLKNTLTDSASMKLGSFSSEEIKQRVTDVIRLVGLEEHKDKYISNLSGGQQKKAAVANQLVGFQKVFICDEPDSGLDAASRMQQMEILHEISKNNKIVIVITHQPDDATIAEDKEKKVLFTKVLVIARSSKDLAGHTAFFGTPEQALEFFEVEHLQEIMRKINPSSEGGIGEADMYIEKFKKMESEQ